MSDCRFSIKREMKHVALDSEVDLDLMTLAQAYVFFEKIVLKVLALRQPYPSRYRVSRQLVPIFKIYFYASHCILGECGKFLIKDETFRNSFMPCSLSDVSSLD